MHGGAKGSGGPRGNRNGNFKHGLFTGEAKAIRRVSEQRFGRLEPWFKRPAPQVGD